MEISTLILFLPACFALNLAPGPNNLLSINNATRYGFRTSCIGGIGRIIAFIVMLSLASFGLAVVLHTSELVFYMVKLVGVVYLLYLAQQLWRAPVETLALLTAGKAKTQFKLAKQEFWVAAGNPKAILIFTAFLPQFVNPSQPAEHQFAILGALFLLLEFTAIMIYAWMGIHMQRLLVKPKAKKLFNRGCATLLTLASFGLLLTQRARS
ncbi:LysE family translocator [Serratia fonticola]|uniref:LysE family translocator n=1 Tax=Serratia fonticola TaxID=47917 RepID=UPI0034C65C64